MNDKQQHSNNMQTVNELAMLSFTDQGLNARLIHTLKFAFTMCAIEPELETHLGERGVSMIKLISSAAFIAKTELFKTLDLKKITNAMLALLMPYVDGCIYVEPGEDPVGRNERDTVTIETLLALFVHAFAVQLDVPAREAERYTMGHKIEALYRLANREPMPPHLHLAGEMQ